MIPTTDLEAMLKRCEKVVAALQAMKKFKGNNHERALRLTKKWMAASDERLKDDEVLAVIRDLIAARKVVEAARLFLESNPELNGTGPLRGDLADYDRERGE